MHPEITEEQQLGNLCLELAEQRKMVMADIPPSFLYGQLNHGEKGFVYEDPLDAKMGEFREACRAVPNTTNKCALHGEGDGVSMSYLAVQFLGLGSASPATVYEALLIQNELYALFAHRGPWEDIVFFEPKGQDNILRMAKPEERANDAYTPQEMACLRAMADVF